MLNFYVALARTLHPARALVWILAALGAGGFVATLFFSRGSADEAYMLASIALLLWSACLLVVVYTFIHPLPARHSADGFFRRMKKTLALGMRVLMAWVMTLLFLAVVYACVRAAGIALDSLGM